MRFDPAQDDKWFFKYDIKAGRFATRFTPYVNQTNDCYMKLYWLCMFLNRLETISLDRKT